jgi:hypothetical protein
VRADQGDVDAAGDQGFERRIGGGSIEAVKATVLRLAQFAREAGRTTAQHIGGYERRRRHATLVAVSLDISAGLTDRAVDMFDRLIGAMFRKAEGRHARAFQGDAKAINEKVRLYARIGAALIAAHETKQDAFGAIATVIPWERFRSSVAEAEALARLGQACALAVVAADPVLEYVALIDPGGKERIPLQIKGLSIAVGGNAHIADKHVRKTSSNGFPHNASFRQGLSTMLWR